MDDGVLEPELEAEPAGTLAEPEGCEPLPGLEAEAMPEVGTLGTLELTAPEG